MNEIFRMLFFFVKNPLNYFKKSVFIIYLDKIWILNAELEILQNNIAKARQIFDQGLIINKNSEKLWIAFSNFELDQNNFARARSLLEKARMNIPLSEELWYYSFILEKKT